MELRTKYDYFSDISKPNETKKRGRKKPVFSAADTELYQWILDQGSRGLIVTNTDIATKAKELIAQKDESTSFKASCAWIAAFKKRKKISTRKPTHVSRKTKFTAKDEVNYVIIIL